MSASNKNLKRTLKIKIIRGKGEFVSSVHSPSQSDLRPAQYGCISPSTLRSIAVQLLPHNNFLPVTKKGTSSEMRKDSGYKCGRNLWDTIPNSQRFSNLISIQINRPQPRTNLKGIRINSLIISDPPIRLAQVMSANQIIRLDALLCHTQISRTVLS